MQGASRCPELYQVCLADRKKLREAQRLCAIADLVVTGIFVLSNISFITVGLYPRSANELSLQVLESILFVSVLLLVALFLVRNFLFPRMNRRIAENIEQYEASEKEKVQLSDELANLKEECKPVQMSTADKLAIAVGGFTVIGGAVLEGFIVADLFCDFGMSTGHGKFIATIDDSIEFCFTVLSLLCIIVKLCSYYSKQKNNDAISKDKEVAVKSKKFDFNAAATMLWISFGLLFASVLIRVVRALEGTHNIKISACEGVFKIGFALATIVGLVEIIVGILSQRDLLFSTDVGDVQVVGVPQQGLVVEYLP